MFRIFIRQLHIIKLQESQLFFPISKVTFEEKPKSKKPSA